jgi:hypothetical protein
MIIGDSKSDVIVSGSIKNSGFKIQASSKAFEILSSNIYTHKIRAVIREISCNAHDAHIAAGNDALFDVHLPTHIEPWFSVRDYGIGLSDQDIREVFTTYFYSTKTNSNDYIGALGLGSKSPFCLVDSFTVVSYHNGFKRSYSCYKSEDGEPQIALLSEVATDEPNGLNISVDVENNSIDSFREEAEYVYSFFNKLPNINIPSVVEKLNNKKKYTIDTPEFKANFISGYQHAVMGNVAYTIPHQYCEGLDIDFNLYFNIGELSFDPGRENLSMDKKTIAALKEKIALIKNNMKSYVEDIIESKTTNFEKALALQNILKGYCIRYMFGHAYIDKLSDKYSLKNTKTSFTIYESSRGRVSSYQTTNTSHLNLNSQLFKYVKGCSARIKNLVRDTNSRVAVFTEDQIKEAGIEPQFISDPSSLPKVERSNTTATVKKGYVYRYNNSSIKKTAWIECSATSIPAKQKIYVEIFNNDIVSSGQFNNNFYRLRKLMTSSFMSGTELFGIKSKFAHSKEFLNDKSWISLDQYLKSMIEDLKKANPIRDQNSSERSGLICRLANVLPDAFTEFKDFVKSVELCKTVNKDAIKFIELYDTNVTVTTNPIDTLEEKILEKYPLLTFVNDGSCCSDKIISELAKYIQFAS